MALRIGSCYTEMSKPNSFLVAVGGETNRHSGLISELLAVMRMFNFRRL
jgi:hypothetical protein